MADHQRIHPVTHEPEASPPPPKASAPLFPQDASRSENGDPESQRYPPMQRTIPYSYSKPPKRSCCKRCLCWTLALIVLLIIVIGVLAAVVYFVFKPKLPKYSVDSMRITQFNYNNNDNSLSATFNVNITARNPNKKIGIYYEGGSHLSVFFNGNQLCEGSLPKFYQGHRNTTVMQVSLTGQTQDAQGLLQSVQDQQQQTGKVPLSLRAKVPVRIKLGGLKLMKWKFLVRCRINVDSLTQDNTIRISDSSCKFRFRF